MTTDSNKAARELLAFYVEAGADAVLGEAPVDRFADVGPALHPPLEGEGRQAESRPGWGESQRQTRSPPPGELRSPTSPLQGEVKQVASTTLPLAPEAAVMAAREAAATAASLDDLRAILDQFEGCALRATASRLVFADGNPAGRVMFVGEAPGRDEDLQGLPFVGRSGQLLDRMLAAIGLDRTSVYIANIVPWRPPGNRTPTPQESQTCLPFIRRQIELADPDLLVCLGGPSAQALLGVREGIMRTRGRWFSYQSGAREIRAIATFHPAFLLRSPLQKRIAWRDFLAIRKALRT
ncbi:MAG: uracil-DNA glycosylase [Rhizobiales bacterium]|nr:uracil-DNA glycosylase [Hyphomicrobiales bacterium]